MWGLKKIENMLKAYEDLVKEHEEEIIERECGPCFDYISQTSFSHNSVHLMIESSAFGREHVEMTTSEFIALMEELEDEL